MAYYDTERAVLVSSNCSDANVSVTCPACQSRVPMNTPPPPHPFRVAPPCGRPASCQDGGGGGVEVEEAEAAEEEEELLLGCI